ncbi:hypothetical protein LINPERPRIM_LOCUS37798, partial [Linum perenne]
PNAIKGRTVRVSLVKRLFDRLPDGSTPEVITYHARAYTWVLVAGVLLADRNGDHIQVHLLQLIGTRGLHPHTAGVVRFSHGCIKSWGGRPFSPLVV